MNWKTYEWIGVQIFFGRYTNELWKTYEWIGAQIFLLEDIRMNWKTYEWIGVRAGHAREAEIESDSAGFGGGHARANPREEKSVWKCFGGVWRWTCQSKPPGSRNQIESASSGVWRWTCQSKPPGSRNHAESLISSSRGFGSGHVQPKHFEPDCFPGVCSGMSSMSTAKPRRVHFQPDFFFPGVCSGMSTAKPRRSTFSLISASRGFALACPPPNPAEALSAWFLLPGGLLWHVHLQTLPKHFQPDFFFAGVCSGMSTPKPRRSTFSLISSSRGLALACPPPNPDEALSPIPRLETSPSHTCFEPDYGLHLGLRIRLFGASDIRIPGLRIKVRPAGIWNSLDNCSDFVQGWLENSDRNMYSPVSSDMVGCLILSYMEVNMLLCRDQSIKY